MEIVFGLIVNYFILFIFIFISIGLTGQSVSEVIDLIQAGKVTDAQTMLAQLERQSGKQPDVLFLKGMLSKSATEAWQLYESIIREFPKSSYAPKARYRLAQLKYAQGLYKSALQYFQTIIQSAEQDKLTHESLYWASQCHLAMNQQDSAVVYLERLLLQSPSLELVVLAQKELTGMNVDSPFAGSTITNQSAPALPVQEPPANDIKDVPINIESEVTDSKPASAQNESVSFPQYTVQIGAFSDRNNALTRKDFFEKKGYRVQIIQQGETKSLYLVWVGAFSNENDARSLANELHTKFDTSTTLIRN